VEEPVRERWTAVQAEVMQLRDAFPLPEKMSTSRSKDVEKRMQRVQAKVAETRAIWAAPVLAFHAWLRSLRILDPACGSGNFLYVTMHSLKRVEVEVFRLLAEIQGDQISTRMDEIDPGQFYGIEVKAWAREIAELTLWIGFHQFWRQQHGDVQPLEPLLRDTGTIECRDAVLAWDEIVHRPEKDRADPTPRIAHPVTGQLVPDPSAKLKYYEYVGARQAEWPEADFIVGNPPYLGNKRMRESFGDGYVDSLRLAYNEVSESVDFVMYWWYSAARCVCAKAHIRAGLITTNSITQNFNRAVVERASEQGARVVWAAPDHPWLDGSDSAAVRVAMTVVTSSSEPVQRLIVDDEGGDRSKQFAQRFNSDLSIGADIARTSSTPLKSNSNLSNRGFAPVGAGFIVDRSEAERLLAADTSNADVLRPFRHGKCLTARPKDEFIIDFGLRSEEQSRRYAILFDIVRTRVKPGRDANADPGRRLHWWRFGRSNSELRRNTAGLRRYIATAYVMRHRVFVFLDESVAPDDKIVTIASDGGWLLGVLSTRVHVAWADRAGTRLGVGNDSTYNNPRCFDAFPFPTLSLKLREHIGLLAERLEVQRSAAIARDERVTMTGMYNVVAKLRTGEPLTPKERTIYELAACGVLRDVHDELDALVAEAYGWPWPMSDEEILERLVALHGVRVEEEKQGVVRWLRPEFQAPGQTTSATPVELALTADAVALASSTAAPMVWPAEAVEQIGAIKRLASSRAVTVDEALQHFTGAKREIVARHLETLEILGEVRQSGVDAPRYHAA
jgi:hypothetical protein